MHYGCTQCVLEQFIELLRAVSALHRASGDVYSAVYLRVDLHHRRRWQWYSGGRVCQA